MSADNGIYLLFTESEKRDPQYRVAHCQGIDSIYGEFDKETCSYKGDPEMIKEYFSKAKVFLHMNEALDYAEELEEKIGYLEDGICVINEFRKYGYLFD